MKQNEFEALQFYCQKESEELKQSDLFRSLEELVSDLQFSIDFYAQEIMDNSKENKWHIGFIILAGNDEMIFLNDEGLLSADTMIVQRDKKGRVKFYSWEDEDFIDSINWTIKELKKIKSGNKNYSLQKNYR